MRINLAGMKSNMSSRVGHQGMGAILGSLVVLSVFMLALGATPAKAQTGQDPRCEGYTGQAHGLCTAAVSEGCFDGVESQECDDLMTIWNERCSQCEGMEVPWEVGCPCAVDGSAFEVNNLFISLPLDGEPRTVWCYDTSVDTHVSRLDVDGYPSYELQVWGDPSLFGGQCLYIMWLEYGTPAVYNLLYGITVAEYAACRADIVSLQNQLGCATP